VEPGEGTLLFGNANGFLDPTNPASPYLALLTPGRILRLVQVRNSDGLDAELFRANVKTWPTRWSAGGSDVTTKLELRDLVWMMGATETPESLVTYELKRGVRYPRPSHLFMLRESETTGDVVLSDDLTDFVATPYGVPAKGSGTLVPYSDVAGLKGGNVGTASTAATGYIGIPLACAPAPPWTYMALESVTKDRAALAWNDNNINLPNLSLSITDDGSALGPRAYARVRQTDNATKFVSGGPRLDDSAPHLLAMNDTGTQLFVYADGVSHGSIVHTAIYQPGGGLFAALGDAGQFAMLAIWRERILAAAQALIWEDVQRPWYTHTGFGRVSALLDMCLPGVPKDFPASVVSLSWLPVSLRRAPLLDILRRTTYADDGRLWVERGVVQRRSRSTAAPGPALRLYGTGGVPVADFTMAEGTEDLVTHARLETEAGVVEVYEDTAASERRGVHRLPDPGPLPLKNPLDLWSLCERIVHYRSQLQPYTDTLDLVPYADGVGFDDTLATKLYDRIDHARTLPWDASVVTEQLEVVGIRHRASGAGFCNWSTQLRTQPVRRQRLRLNVTNVTPNAGASTPNSVANSVTGNIDIRARWWQNDWQQAFAGLVSKGLANTAGGAYEMYARAGRTEFVWHEAGGTLRVAVSASWLAQAGARPVWGRVTLNVTSGAVTFYRSEDGSDWAIVSSVTPVAGTSVRDTSAALEVGARNGGAANPLNGRLLYAEVRNGIAGPVAARFDPNESSGVSPWVASTGETWTVRSASSIEAF
jgi:hypothetical protein